MKFSFDKLLRFIKKNKYVILGVIALIIVIMMSSKSVIEGFGTQIGKYQYLAPIPPGNTISDDLVKRYIDYNNNKSCPNGKTGCNLFVAPDNYDYIKGIKNTLESYALPEEIEYYLNNGKWPYGSYLIDYLTKDLTDKPFLIPVGLSVSEAVNRMQSGPFSSPSRKQYEQAILRKEEKLTPQPLSYQIYMGSAKPPSEQPAPVVSPAPPVVKPPPVVSPVSSPINPTVSKQTTSYNDFLNLCKRALNTK